MTEAEALEILKRDNDDMRKGYFCINDFLALEVAIKALEKQIDGNWIPCSERLPELKQEVLITADDYSVYQGVMANGGFMIWEEGWIDTKRTLAWQPLPAPYQKGE